MNDDFKARMSQARRRAMIVELCNMAAPAGVFLLIGTMMLGSFKVLPQWSPVATLPVSYVLLHGGAWLSKRLTYSVFGDYLRIESDLVPSDVRTRFDELEDELNNCMKFNFVSDLHYAGSMSIFNRVLLSDCGRMVAVLTDKGMDLIYSITEDGRALMSYSGEVTIPHAESLPITAEHVRDEPVATLVLTQIKLIRELPPATSVAVVSADSAVDLMEYVDLIHAWDMHIGGHKARPKALPSREDLIGYDHDGVACISPDQPGPESSEHTEPSQMAVCS